MESKKRWYLSAFVLMLMLLLAACGGGDDGAEEGDEGGENGESAGESHSFRFVTEEVDGQVQYEYAEEFAKRVEEKTDGRITMDVYEFGELGSEVDQVEQLQQGAVDFAIISPGFTGTMVEEGQLFALHFLFPDDQRVTQDILDQSEALNEDLAALYEEQDIKPLAFWTEGAMQWTGNKELRTPEDFEGFKMRTQESPLITRSYEAYGADPTAMSWSELYTGLQQGAVEGQENPIFFIQDASFHEVQDYMTISNHNNYVTMTTVSPTVYNNLSEEDRQIIDDTVEEMQDFAFDMQKEMNAELLDEIKNNEDTPTEVIELTEEERAAFREKAVPVRDYFRENGGEKAAEILDKLEGEIEEISGEPVE